MSSYRNHVREAELDQRRKPVYKTIALVAVEEDNIEQFDKLMTERNNRWAGEMVSNTNGVYVGWISYEARGSNMHDITRVFENVCDVLHKIEIVHVMDLEEITE